MKHFYNTIQGWCTFTDFYKQVVDQAKSDFHIVEVGVWKGMSAAYMAVEIINSGKKIRFDCIDTWEGSEEHIDPKSPFYEPLLLQKDGLYNHFLSNIEPVKDVINVIRKSSLDASLDYEDKSINCVFIDAAHDYDNALKDINAWLPKIKSGGILTGHDIAYEPVKTAVYDALGSGILTIQSQDVWIFKVK
jgi:predicted O-methyltransferase YrrM